ncbi:MAG: RNA-directed DNA polymerase [Candidatus Riflebacteria bacterium]|nr:RNA-directed DNA polymerase [Candidatus Riflebacteria bacterium]
MRKYRNLFEDVVSPENVLRAFYRAHLGKRYRVEANRFHLRLEENVLDLAEELATGTYEPGAYRSFLIREPKERLVSAAPFRDRVVHHAICAVVEPIFETKFIEDTYACRVGKGQHKALDRFTAFARRHSMVMKLDVRRFFPGVDHRLLLGLLGRTLDDARLMQVITRIVASGAKVHPASRAPDYFPGDHLFTPLERPKGLPIGNLTSQLFANVYLSPLDDHIKRRLGCQAYVRYMDDMVLFADDRASLLALRHEVSTFLSRWRLRVHEDKCRICSTARGMPYLGFLVYPDHRRVLGSGVRRFSRRLTRLQAAYAVGDVQVPGVRQSIAGWMGHAQHADTLGLRTAVLGRFGFTRSVDGPQRSKGTVGPASQPALGRKAGRDPATVAVPGA